MNTHPKVAPMTLPMASSPSVEPTLHLVSGDTMRAALLKARSTYGKRAVVVESTKLGGRVTLAVSTVVPRSTDALHRMREDAQGILRSLPAPAPPTVAQLAPLDVSSPDGSATRSPLADVERRLREHGASTSLREAVLASVVAAEGQDEHPLDLAADEVGKAFRVAKLPLPAGETAVVAFLGQTGVGKTTTIAKLALRLVRAGRSVALATLDTDRVGAASEIRSFGKMLSVPTMLLKEPGKLGGALAAQPGRFDVVLVDGTGDVDSDVTSLMALGDSCDQADGKVQLATLLVLPATASLEAMQSTTRRAAPIAPMGVVLTKLDETSAPIPSLEHANAAGLGIAFLNNGPDLGPHFFRAAASRFADLALTGKIG